jgi:hypothetical protein
MEKWLKHLMLSALTSQVNEVALGADAERVSLHCGVRLRRPHVIGTIHASEKSAMTSQVDN